VPLQEKYCEGWRHDKRSNHSTSCACAARRRKPRQGDGSSGEKESRTGVRGRISDRRHSSDVKHCSCLLRYHQLDLYLSISNNLLVRCAPSISEFSWPRKKIAFIVWIVHASGRASATSRNSCGHGRYSGEPASERINLTISAADVWPVASRCMRARRSGRKRGVTPFPWEGRRWGLLFRSFFFRVLFKLFV
jgi:hypothetical protein